MLGARTWHPLRFAFVAGLLVGCQAAPSAPTDSPTAVTASAVPSLPSSQGRGPITTEDGTVAIAVSDSSDGYQIVLTDPAGASRILVRITERQPAANESFGSIHTADCPPSTGLRQQYYVLGQETGPRPPIAVEHLGLVGAEIVDSLYLVAVSGPPPRDQPWAVRMGGQQIGGGVGASFLDLATTGQRSESGCFFDP
jgi:hypothetical protein